MKKGEAIDYVNQKLNLNLDHQNTSYSNPGSSLALWWLEPANPKFNSGFYFILHHAEKKQLLLFKIPKGAVKPSQFRQREDKNASQIIIPISDTSFTDRRGFHFTPYLTNVVSY